MKKTALNGKLLKVAIAILVLCSPVTLFAQDLPCDGTDAYSTCPLDSWVIVLAGVALVFAALHLHRKQKSQQAANLPK
ncbi:hypothetical protein [Mucilaginibacter sp.]|uniref:hypothetical protein n=1 Tax=Mucilaginibacter sp. TaxID=1882438 RepID=UPI003D1444D8